MRWNYVDPEVEMQKWHKWFAWYPVIIDDKKVWLETVERRARSGLSHHLGDIDYQYRFIEHDSSKE